MKTKLIIFCMMFLTWNAFAQQEKQTSKFKDSKIAASYVEYINLKEALVKTDFDEAKKASQALQKSLAELSSAKSAYTEAGKIVSAENIAGQRKFFASLTDAFLPVVKESKALDAIIYLQHCPMANGGEGANWISNEKEVRNPYFGDKMLTCGSSEAIK